MNRIIDGKVAEYSGQVLCNECDWTCELTSPDLIEKSKEHVIDVAHSVTIKLTLRLFNDREFDRLRELASEQQK